MTPSQSLPLPEMDVLGRLLSAEGGALAHAETLVWIEAGSELRFPLQAVRLGTRDPQAPVLAFVGGIHGLERIGTDVALAYLGSLIERLRWSVSLQEQLEKIRILFIPIMNPIGMARSTRCNGNGVDLMRNAPVESKHAIRFFGGQRWSPRLPYYRGREADGPEPELRSLEAYLRREAFSSKAFVLLDIHSGFGGTDRIWFPYAREPEPFPHLPETLALIQNFERAFPNHPYVIEPQAKSYCTHGDFWDYLYDHFYAEPERAGSLFLPLTLEMGSWRWVRKNPWQLYSFLGAFNPIKPHRKRRVLRGHLPLLDFLRDAAHSSIAWSHPGPVRRQLLRQEALVRWYAGKPSHGEFLTET